MHVEEIKISDDDNSSFGMIKAKAIGISTIAGVGIGAGYAYFNKEKYWKSMLIGGVCFAVISSIFILRK